MEKLITLLNEYDEWWNWNEYNWIGLWCEDHNTIWYKDKNLSCEQDEIVAYLISKSYGFIKRLVDNDKIDKSNKFLISVNVENDKWVGYVKAFEGYESLLMLLAIQDKPIEFLLSIIK